MRVREVMTKPVLSFSMGEPASDALATMRDAGVSHAIVLRGTELAGVLSERDLGGSFGGVVRAHHFVADLMQAEPVVIDPEADVRHAAELMLDHDVGCLPVTERGQVIGIVTRSDLLRAAYVERRTPRPPPPATAADERPPRLVSPNRDKSP